MFRFQSFVVQGLGVEAFVCVHCVCLFCVASTLLSCDLVSVNAPPTRGQNQRSNTSEGPARHLPLPSFAAIAAKNLEMV